MKFHILSASLVIAASTLLPMSSTAAPFNASEGFRVAQEQSEPGMRKRGRKGQQWMQELNLSSEQQQSIQAIKEKYKGQMQGDREKMRQLKTEMQQFMVNGSKDDIRTTHQQIQEYRQKKANARLEMMLEVRDVLTPEQREKMAELKEQRWQGRRGKRGQATR